MNAILNRASESDYGRHHPQTYARLRAGGGKVRRENPQHRNLLNHPNEGLFS
jgi:hypothetical protein